MKVNEQIAFLRKQKGISQEKLAQELGVTNQSVSKWENAQCCPDIELLPALASYFHVSVDELIGYEKDDTSADLFLQIRSTVDSLPRGEADQFALKMAFTLHTVLLSKTMNDLDETGEEDGMSELQIQRSKRIPCLDSDHVFDHAGRGDWGYSCLNDPEISTTMRHNTVFFSGNGEQCMSNPWFRWASSLMKALSDAVNLKTLFAIYNLTVAAEDLYTDIPAIAEKSGLPEAKVAEAIEKQIWEYLQERTEEGKTCYRIKGEHMHVVPLLTLFSFYG